MPRASWLARCTLHGLCGLSRLRNLHCPELLGKLGLLLLQLLKLLGNGLLAGFNLSLDEGQ